MLRLKQNIKKLSNIFIHLNLSPLTLICAISYILGIILIFVKDKFPDQEFNFTTLAVIFFSLITLILFTESFSLLTFSKRRIITATVNIFMVLLYWILFFYHYSTNSSFNYSIAAENIGEAFQMQSLQVIYYTIGGKYLLILAFIIILFIIWEVRSGIFTSWKPSGWRWRSFFFSFFFFILLVISPVSSMDEFGSFFQSVYHHYYINIDFSEIKDELSQNEYPYVKGPEKLKKHLEDGSDRPHVFIITLESFNVNFVESRTDDGREYTPFLNSLIRKGFYVENFYGNSVQTCKGQIAMLASIYPSIYKKVFKRYLNWNFSTLPAVLKDYGYSTIFLQAYHNLRFDKTGRFMNRNGFEIVRSMDKSLITGEDEKYIWGWGLQDDVFYQKFFTLLDEEYNGASSSGNEEKFFCVLAPISNHMRFNLVPVEQRYLFPDQEHRIEGYANSFRVTDEYLKEFFNQLSKRDYLENSIIIITSDHGYPAGENRNWYNEKGFYEENFRIPFLLLWEGGIETQRIKDKAFSQVDITPTILDLLDIEVVNHYQGVSILENKPGENQVFLIQPYDGKYLSVVRYPFKYAKHLRTGNEYLFNLEQDPSEDNNLISNIDYKSLSDSLRQSLMKLYKNEYLLKRNRIWPVE